VSQSSATLASPKPRIGPAFHWWRVAIPVILALALAALPAPPGLAQHAWYYFAIFAGVIAALVTEPLPNPAVGLIGLSLTAGVSRWVLYSPADQAKPGFNVVSQTINWALSGFSSTTVWLVAGAFMFALGYQKTGLGRRIALLLVRALGRNTLMVGYATTFSDAILAPFTPSNTARSAGIIFPIVSALPALYDSQPNDASARRFVAPSCGRRSPQATSRVLLAAGNDLRIDLPCRAAGNRRAVAGAPVLASDDQISKKARNVSSL
jgi:di/tricarboxylate transporter